ncbi:MAG: hypothetical protein E8D49_10540 [Nitrospira sp.]|nr:MAG: hypothetical protein E8D49_10540 [Nitrospira sp.]
MLRLFRRQPATEVLVRDPAKRAYNSPEPADNYAPLHWEYAAMSSAAYEKARFKARHGDRDDAGPTLTASPSLPRWSRWADFPSDELLEKLSSSGLYVDVWEREEQPKAIAVVFEGTNFTSMSDWRANLRWFLRFLPSFEDQYTIAADEVARELYERLATNPARYEIKVGNAQLLSASGDPIKLVATGHSLGGGLAQHFAYAFQQPFASGGPKVSEVFAFDASPVTGWSVVPRGIRSCNAHNLRINRVFEHGEILALVRLVTSRLLRYTEHPSVWEYRYNFDPSWNLVRNHSIGMLAQGLKKAAGLTT